MKPLLIAGILLGGSGVVLGAFGAHGLETALTADQLDSWKTGVLYQLFHAVVILLVAHWAKSETSAWLLRAGWLLVGGVILFSGSIYGLLLTGMSWLGPVTPLGGVAFVAGWAALLWTAIKTG